MAKIENFEELKIWKIAISIAVEVICYAMRSL